MSDRWRRFMLGWALTCCMFAPTGCDRQDSAATSTTNPSGGGSGTRVVVIPKGTTHSFWNSVEAGARKASEEAGIQMSWRGPLKEDDREAQKKLVEQFVTEGVSGIVLAPLDAAALKNSVAAARDKKIPVVIIDSALNGEVGKDFISFVATDNHKAGMMAGEELARLLVGKGKVVMLRYAVGSASTEAREAGFIEAIGKSPDIQVISDNRYGGATMDSAKAEAMRMIDKLQDADGIFTPNESTTFGMLLALKQNNLAGKKKFVGFDTADSLLAGVEAGQIDALVAQNPMKMGYEGVKVLVAHLKGEPVPPRVDTGAMLITKQNLGEPATKELLGR